MSNLEGNWTDDSVAYAIQKWKEGLSCQQIADAIAKQFRLHPSRNAVIGKLNRLGYTRANPSAPAKAPSVSRSHVRPPRPPAGSAGGKPALVHASGYRKAAPEEVEAVRAERLAIGKAALKSAAVTAVESPNARSFLETPRIGVCKWPIGEGLSMLACCNEVARGSYCQGHADIAFSRVQPPERDRGDRLASSFTRFDRVAAVAPIANDISTLWDLAA